MSYEQVFRQKDQRRLPLDVFEKFFYSVKELEFLVSGMATRIPNGENRNNLEKVSIALQNLVECCEDTLNGKNQNTIQPKGP